MQKGDARFVVRDRGPAAGEKGYCRDCGTAMLDKAIAELEQLRHEIAPET